MTEKDTNVVKEKPALKYEKTVVDYLKFLLNANKHIKILEIYTF